MDADFSARWLRRILASRMPHTIMNMFLQPLALCALELSCVFDARGHPVTSNDFLQGQQWTRKPGRMPSLLIQESGRDACLTKRPVYGDRVFRHPCRPAGVVIPTKRAHLCLLLWLRYGTSAAVSCRVSWPSRSALC